MKLVSADFHPEDIKSIQALVKKIQEKDKTMTIKKYVSLCIVMSTDAIFKQMQREIAQAEATTAVLVPDETI